MKIYNCIQGTPEWLAVRNSRATASRFKDIITAVKGDLSKSSAVYIRELIGEYLCPDYLAFSGNKFTDRGTELEPEARAAFIALSGETVIEVGFVTRDDDVIGCSPDGIIVSPAGKWLAGLEIKCPSPKLHIQYVEAGVLPDEYKQQIHGQLAVTGLPEVHFWSYCPGMNPFHLVVRRDDYTAKVVAALDQFLTEYRETALRLLPKLQPVTN